MMFASPSIAAPTFESHGAKLRAAWEAYEEWSEEYAWQAGLSGTIVDLDPDDGTVQIYYGEEEVEVEGVKPPVTFETAPIKHIKDKTLKPFRRIRRFLRSTMCK